MGVESKLDAGARAPQSVTNKSETIDRPLKSRQARKGKKYPLLKPRRHTLEGATQEPRIETQQGIIDETAEIRSRSRTIGIAIYAGIYALHFLQNV